MFENIPNVKLGLIAVSRDCFPRALSEMRRANIVKACEGGVYECPVTVENENDMLKAVADVKAAECNALVVFLGNFGPETPETLIAKYFDGPCMFVAAAEGDGDLINGRGDSYCGMLNCSYNLGMRHLKGYIPEYPVGTADDSGALKGFVSISPTWSGIDNRAFQDISRQVYNEDEFYELQRRANIMNGRTHSNVVSMTLNDYRVAPGVMFMTRSDPQLTFSQRSMKLNAACWEKLGQQKYVEFLYHPVLEVIAVRSCNATKPNAVLWDETKKSGLQLCTSAFSNAVYDKLDWMRKYKFRFRGVTRVRGGERIIFFFLDEPQILVGKDKKNLDAMDTSDSTVKYIPYKESECGEAAGLTAGIAYPENWQEQVGVSYEIKQQRGRVLDAVSSADIRNHGTKVVNPFIGVIPTHGELEDELEQIYEAM